MGDAPAKGLGASLRRAGFSVARLKTGTPPRLDGATIHWDRLEPQWGDAEPEPFSALDAKDRKSPDRLSHHPHDACVAQDHTGRSLALADADWRHFRARSALLPVDRG